MPLLEKHVQMIYDDSRQHIEKYNQFHVIQLSDKFFFVAPNSNEVTQLHAQKGFRIVKKHCT